MAIQLIITDTRNPKDRFSRSFVQDKVTIGRARYCDVCLPDLSVSTGHAEVRLHDNDFWLVDTGSLNGTFVVDRKLVAHRPKRLASNDVFIIAGFEIQFRMGAFVKASNERNQAQNHALKMLASVLSMTSAPVAPSLEVLAGPGKSQRFQLAPAPSVAIIGRAMDSDIRLDDPDVSRRHAEVVFENGKITVSDLGSRRGIYFNDGRRKSFELAEDGVFTVGQTTLGLAHPLDPNLQHIQNAPEEETASFCTGLSSVDVLDVQNEEAVNDASRLATPEHEVESENGVAPVEQGDTADGDANGDGGVSSVSASSNPPADTNPGIAASMASENAENPYLLPTGPADPLEVKAPVDAAGVDQIPEQKSQKSDLGLIVVGAIVVVSCVLVLIRLLT